jgi:hypothetical protein
MKGIVAGLLFFLSISVSSAQTKDDGQELINRFFDLYKNKGYEYALKYAFETNKWINAEGDEMLAVSVRLGKQVAPLGEYLGNEELRSISVGTRFRIVSYFAYYQREPLRFIFELYKNASGWEILDVQFDVDYDAEIMEAIRFTAPK